MALATRCPNCQALFRVVADQLKLRGGLVRCGSCRHVFDAIGSLAYVDDNTMAAPHVPAAAGKSSARPSNQSPPTLHAGTVAPPARQDQQERVVPAPRGAPVADHVSPVAKREDGTRESKRTSRKRTKSDPTESAVGVPTLLVTTTSAGRAAEQAAKALQRKQEKEERAATEQDAEAHDAETPAAPAFLREEDAPSRGFSIIFGGGTTLLALLFIAQLAVVFRTDLVTRWPAARPVLVQLCGVFDCFVGWPTRAELLAIVGTELQAIPGTDVLELTAVVRNRANFKLALPAVEVTLTDTQNRTVARKVFAPVDYLASAGDASARIDDGLGAGSDYTIRIAFEARGISAVGFVVYPFYL